MFKALLGWIGSNFRATVWIVTFIVVPCFSYSMGFAYGFYEKVVQSEADNVQQYRMIQEDRAEYKAMRNDMATMSGNMSSIKEDTRAIKEYFMKRAVER